MLLLGATGIASVMAWMPPSASLPGLVHAADARASSTMPVNAQMQSSTAHGRVKCPECGIVESTRDEKNELFEKSANRRTVTVRMQNGTHLVFVNRAPTNWRVGERVIIIASVNQSNE